MTGSGDAAAIEAAELRALRDQVRQQRQDISATAQELAARLDHGSGLAAAARHEAAGAARRAARRVLRRLPGPAVAAIPAAAAALAVTWLLARHRREIACWLQGQSGSRRSRPRR